jgi:hypothetical protein
MQEEPSQGSKRSRRGMVRGVQGCGRRAGAAAALPSRAPHSRVFQPRRMQAAARRCSSASGTRAWRLHRCALQAAWISQAAATVAT